LNSVENRKGNLEHLHLYCPSKPLTQARSHCNEKVEEALTNLYNFASMRQYNLPLKESSRMTVLQENMIYAAKEAELQERKIIYLGKCTPATRQIWQSNLERA